MKSKMPICLTCFEPLKKGPVVEYTVPGFDVPRHEQTQIHRQPHDHDAMVCWVPCDRQEDYCKCCGDLIGERTRFKVEGIWRRDGNRAMYCRPCVAHPREQHCDKWDSVQQREYAAKIEAMR